MKKVMNKTDYLDYLVESIKARFAADKENAFKWIEKNFVLVQSPTDLYTVKKFVLALGPDNVKEMIKRHPSGFFEPVMDFDVIWWLFENGFDEIVDAMAKAPLLETLRLRLNLDLLKGKNKGLLRKYSDKIVKYILPTWVMPSSPFLSSMVKSLDVRFTSQWVTLSKDVRDTLSSDPQTYASLIIPQCFPEPDNVEDFFKIIGLNNYFLEYFWTNVKITPQDIEGNTGLIQVIERLSRSDIEAIFRIKLQNLYRALLVLNKHVRENPEFFTECIKSLVITNEKTIFQICRNVEIKIEIPDSVIQRLSRPAIIRLFMKTISPSDGVSFITFNYDMALKRILPELIKDSGKMAAIEERLRVAKSCQKGPTTKRLLLAWIRQQHNKDVESVINTIFRDNRLNDRQKELLINAYVKHMLGNPKLENYSIMDAERKFKDLKHVLPALIINLDH